MNKTLISQRILRLVGTESPKASRSPIDTLRAVPHIDYLRNFSRIEWDPALMSLERIGMGYEPTLVAAPKAALGWLTKIECVREGFLEIPLLSRAPFDIWQALPELPEALQLSPNFVAQGGFVNYWVDEEKTHVLWGRVNPESAQSVLAFVWLQNVLAGGKRWRRRELGNLPRDFEQWLPLSYLCMGEGKVQTVTMGLRRPILRTNAMAAVHSLEWIEAGREDSSVEADSLHSVVVPDVAMGREELTVFVDCDGTMAGLYLKLSEEQRPAMIGFYPSMMGSQIDRHQEGWEHWMQTAIGEMSQERRMEILLCLREALLNADKHGCGGKPGKRILMILKKDAAHRLLKAQISDPGNGHKHDINAPAAVQDQQRGKHLGLMLIHGLADRVRFGAGGATIEFDFGY